MKKSLLLPGLMSVMTAPVFAAAVSYDFNSSADDTFFTDNGVPNWTQTPNTNPASPVDPTVIGPVAVIYGASFENPGGVVTSSAAFLGTLYGNYSTNITTTLTAPLTDAGSISGSRFSVDFAIASDIESAYPTRDVFGFSITNSVGDTMATISLVPDAADFSVWNFSYSTGADLAQTTTSPVTMGSSYTLFVNFLEGSIVINYGRTSVGTQEYNIATVATSVTSGASYGDIKVFTTPQGDPGDSSNSLIFDNVLAAVPEPSSLLLSAFASLGLLRRRRQA